MPPLNFLSGGLRLPSIIFLISFYLPLPRCCAHLIHRDEDESKSRISRCGNNIKCTVSKSDSESLGSEEDIAKGLTILDEVINCLQDTEVDQDSSNEDSLVTHRITRAEHFYFIPLKVKVETWTSYPEVEPIDFDYNKGMMKKAGRDLLESVKYFFQRVREAGVKSKLKKQIKTSVLGAAVGKVWNLFSGFTLPKNKVTNKVVPISDDADMTSNRRPVPDNPNRKRNLGFLAIIPADEKNFGNRFFDL